MHSRFHIFILFITITLYCSLLCGCGGNSQEETFSFGESQNSSIPKGNSSLEDSSASESTQTVRNTITVPLLPESDSSLVFENEIVSLDASSTSQGYFILDYHGSAGKIKLQVKTPDGTTYSYPLKTERSRSFPLTGGNGSYQISVLEHAYDDLYAVAFSQEIDVSIENEFLPFLYPNQFSWYNDSSKAILKGRELSGLSTGDLDYLEKVYLWVIQNITYDNEKAESVTTEYVPDVDDTLVSGKGICFDYASLMVAMLRSQNIPTKLEVGYSGQVYHAWISVYLKEYGWIDDIIEFDGSSWTLMDPTLASNNDKKSVGKYIGDGSNYTVKYHY